MDGMIFVVRWEKYFVERIAATCRGPIAEAAIWDLFGLFGASVGD
jgi:hypothetical protein